MSTDAMNDPYALVDAFVEKAQRYPALVALQALGAAALPAIRAGLEHENWHVRHWCAICLDRHGDASGEALESLLPLLHDPASKVRLWAVHSLSCDHCKPYQNPIDAVPLLVERLENDPSLRVRKMAAAMLALMPPDPRALPALEQALAREHDRKIRLHLDRALGRHRQAEASAG